MFPYVMTIDTAASLSPIDEYVLTDIIKPYIEPCTGVTPWCSSKTKVKHLGQLRLYISLQDLLVPVYCCVLSAFPLKILLGTNFCNRHIEEPYLAPDTPELVFSNPDRRLQRGHGFCYPHPLAGNNPSYGKGKCKHQAR